MKRRSVPVVLSIIFMLSTLYIQAEKADFEAAERFAPEKMRKLVGSRQVIPNWINKSDVFWYQYETAKGTNYYIVDANSGTKKTLFNRIYLAGEIAKILNKGFDEKKLPIKEIKFNKGINIFTFVIEKAVLSYNRQTRNLKLVKKKEKEKLERWQLKSPDGKWEVYVRNYNLYFNKIEGKEKDEIRLTKDGCQYFSYGRDDEKLIQTKKYKPRGRWFEDSKKFFIKRVDKREVGDIWLVHSLSNPRPTLERYKYSLPGEKNIPGFELSVFDLKDKRKVVINTDKWEGQETGSGFFGIYTLKNNSDKIYFLRRNRTWDTVEFCVADTKTGKSKVLIHEESKPYIHYQFCHAYLINKTQEFIWWSERDGWGHFYLYDHNGKLKRQLTKGNFHARSIVKIDEDKRQCYFLAYGKEKNRDPYYQFYYKTRLDGMGMKLLTREDATHTFYMSESKRYFLDTFSRVDKVPESYLCDNNGNKILKLETMDVFRLKEYGWKNPEMFKVKAANKITDLYGVMWKPFNFDPTKKYPIISYCYPGPQGEPVTKTFFQIRDQRVHNVPLAQLGFIVITVGQRGGSPLRSRFYHTYGYENARDYPLRDNKYAIEQLAAKYPFIDINRVGIYGRSGGGFMSTAAILMYPKFYKVAISSCGNHDNNIYHSSWGEGNYGVKEVIEKFKGQEVTTYKTKIATNPQVAKNLKGHILLLHGEIDNNVHPANTMRMADALIKAGKRFDMMIFPGKRHAYGDETTRYIERMMWYYFAEYLLGDYQSHIDIFKYTK